MNPCLIRSRALRAALVLLMFGLPACGQMHPPEPVMMNNPLLADPRPWCIGRLVIERPARSKLSFEEYEYWGDKIEVTHNVSAGTFQHKVKVREEELRKNKRTILIPYHESVARGLNNGVVETDAAWLEQAVSPTPFSRLLIYKEFGHADASLRTEGYILAGTTMLTMKAAVGYDGVQKFIELTNDEYRNITQRDNWTVPTERGFCIDGALIGGPSRNSEGATQFIVLEAGQASWFMVKMRDAVNADLQSSLLRSLPNLRRELHTQGYNGSVRVLRKGKRQVAGMDAEEVLFSVKEGDIQLFRFYLLAPGNPDSTAQPHTEIELSLGEVLTDADKRSGMKPEELSSLLDDAGAIQVWDTLLNSMRLRPGAM